VVCFNRLGDTASTLRRGDQVFVAGLLASSRYDREIGNRPEKLKLTSWQIRASVLRKLNRTAKEAPASGSSHDATAAPF
jgi:single-stranded DNA-binding protein